MKNILSLIFIASLLYFSWPILSEQQSADGFRTEIDSFKEHPELSEAIKTVNSGIAYFIGQLDSVKEKLANEGKAEIPIVEKPELTAPEEQTFSIHNIEIGEGKAAVEKQLGQPQRISINDYGTKWNAYHENYQNFVMVSYDEEQKVDGLYTNQDLIAAKNEVEFGSKKERIREQLGEPLTEIVKGMVRYQLPEERDYDVYQLDGSYVTIFYDKHNDYQVTAIQLVSKQLEENKPGFYAEGTKVLKEGFEHQLFDITNASRVNHGLAVLKWDDAVKVTARKHSKDMADHQYFSHTNREGESPFERMAEDGIAFKIAGENLAYGQFSSIFAHEGLMNSLGHRENILKTEYELLGVGVAFGENGQPFFTENFYSKSL
ncbi:CAP domain-containing protein [Bacillus sp. REN3]|uniref:CAP domain-containing protein n=1 Tax=Bacillus sp. REN3 TaxID=2802440 RepID=UPI001AEF22F5|nr:CAP domain-containing protein [Bacillus sp. REN3]